MKSKTEKPSMIQILKKGKFTKEMISHYEEKYILYGLNEDWKYFNSWVDTWIKYI